VPDGRRLRADLAAALASVPHGARDVPEGGRVGSVLVLLVDDEQHGIEVVLTRRHLEMRSHPGQVAFPGGRVDEGEDLVDAALREAQEEIALDPASVTVLGRGRTFYLPPSRFWVAPVVAWWDAPHELVASPDEVDEVLRVPLTALFDPARWRAVPLSAGGATWAWQLDDDLLWGATAIVLALLLGEVLPGWHGGTSPEDLEPELHVRPWEDAPAWTPRTRLPYLPGRPVRVVPAVGRRGLSRLLTGLGRAGVAAAVDRGAERVTEVVVALLGGDVDGRAVTVLVGPAGTGTVGLGVARRLLAAGALVTVRLAASRDDVEDLPDWVVVDPPTSDRQARLDRSGVDGPPDVPELDRPAGELIVDALLGPGADPPLRGGPGLLAAWAARHDVPVVAVALPSGVAADTGLTGPSLHADVTVALGLPTSGLLAPIVAPYAGEVVVADVGIPLAAWAEVGVAPPDDLFADGPVVRLDRGRVNSDAGTPDQGPAA
jgi:NAD(P)H-hydrate repair Nnr-like enzyme with NAD(P)H-hydrate epimerase domain/8-oxo-dGTP pyrophosphatase MutT (NUDIX family)